MIFTKVILRFFSLPQQKRLSWDGNKYRPTVAPESDADKQRRTNTGFDEKSDKRKSSRKVRFSFKISTNSSHEQTHTKYFTCARGKLFCGKRSDFPNHSTKSIVLSKSLYFYVLLLSKVLHFFLISTKHSNWKLRKNWFEDFSPRKNFSPRLSTRNAEKWLQTPRKNGRVNSSSTTNTGMFAWKISPSMLVQRTQQSGGDR